jgi:hypothetical protein
MMTNPEIKAKAEVKIPTEAPITRTATEAQTTRAATAETKTPTEVPARTAMVARTLSLEAQATKILMEAPTIRTATEEETPTTKIQTEVRETRIVTEAVTPTLRTTIRTAAMVALITRMMVLEISSHLEDMGASRFVFSFCYASLHDFLSFLEDNKD